jgi:hypothetical protein
MDARHPKRLQEKGVSDWASKEPKECSDALTDQQLPRKAPALSPCSLRGSTGPGSYLLHASSDITTYNTSSVSQSSVRGSVRDYPHLHPSRSSTTTDSKNIYTNNNTYMNLSGSKKHKGASSVASVGLPRSGSTGSESASGLPLSCSAITLGTAHGSSRLDLSARHVEGTNCRQSYFSCVHTTTTRAYISRTLSAPSTKAELYSVLSQAHALTHSLPLLTRVVVPRQRHSVHQAHTTGINSPEPS